MSAVSTQSSASYTIAEASALTGLHKNTIRMRVKLGQLEAEVRQGKFGEEYRIPHAALVRAGLIEGIPGELDPPDEETAPGESDAAPSPVAMEEAETREQLPVVAGGLRELFQRHEQAMFRLG